VTPPVGIGSAEGSINTMSTTAKLRSSSTSVREPMVT
jgi:hypothetical protein